MQLCFDATRFGCGLDGAVELASRLSFPAVEYAFAPFTVAEKNGSTLTKKEKVYLASVLSQAKDRSVEVACLNLDYCFTCGDENAIGRFMPMLVKVGRVAQAIDCPRICFSVMPAGEENWQEKLVTLLSDVCAQLADKPVRLLLRLSTPVTYRDQSLQHWQAMNPQNWRDIVAGNSLIGLNFSPADCVWLGIDYLRAVSGVMAAVEHVEAHDIEINRDLLADSGLYGPLWWRYRTIGKGQVDWRQLIEALKLYDFKGNFSIHLDDEFISSETENLENCLLSSLKLIAPLLRG